MKNLTIILVFLCLCFAATAQTQADSIQEAFSKLQNLENRITLQDAQIAILLQQVDEVTKQNLALKKNLNLTPTIASAKAGTLMEYKIVEVTGNPETKEVHLVIVADNISGEDKRISYFNIEIIDDAGHGHTQDNLFSLKVIGENDKLYKSYLDHHVNAPYTIDLFLYDCNPDIQYIKYLSLDLVEGIKHYPAVFENLPIKWNN